MYALLISPNNSLPTVMNMNSSFYPDMLQSGYEPIRTGCKKDIEAEFEEMILEYAEALD